ncbi:MULTISPECIES: hypothetical protein [unclassified Streptomyces]|uniref:hypothetical protein n=1 Tax=unclassified Streptomyces TaxID=2593676 RepID=UPI002E1965C9|nr:MULTISPECIES: hypothetical protein [unclassified Streptomyces]
MARGRRTRCRRVSHPLHFAWDLPEDPAKGLKARVRRIIYELGPIGAATNPGATKDGTPIREWIYGTDGEPVLIVGDKVDADTGAITRTYPWAPGKPSGITCYLTDAEWLLDDLKGGHTVYNLPDDRAAYRVRSDGEVLQQLDLKADFIPVIHITNTIPEPGGALGYGRARHRPPGPRRGVRDRHRLRGGLGDHRRARRGTRCSSPLVRLTRASPRCGSPAPTSTRCFCA